MTRPYLIYRSVRYLIDIPILFIAFWIVSSYFPGSFASVARINYTFMLFSVVAWYSCAQVSHLYTDLRTNKFSQEITYIIFTILLFS
ncbi:MAG: hypothetical protein ACYCZO_01935, partial [Daejeonella sp.]